MHDLLERTVEPTKQALADAGITAADIEHVVLVGGMTRMPAVQEKVKELIGKEPLQGRQPGRGGRDRRRYPGGCPQGRGQGRPARRDAALLGIETKGGVFTKLIDRNTTIPTRKSEVFTTAEDNQLLVEIHVGQGESEMIGFNKTLGKFQLVGIAPAAPRHAADRGLVRHRRERDHQRVREADLGTGNEQQIRSRAARAHRGRGRADDQRRRVARRGGAQAARACGCAERRGGARLPDRALAEHRDKLEEGDASTIEGRIMELRQAVEGSDVAEIKAKTDALQEASRSLADAVYAQASAQAAPQPSGNGGAEDEVVEDADFEVIDEEEARFVTSIASKPTRPRRWRSRPPPDPTRTRRPSSPGPRPSATNISPLPSGFRPTSRTTASARCATRSGWSRTPTSASVRELLLILDDLERALEAAERHEEAALVEGVKLVELSLRKALEKEGAGDRDRRCSTALHEAMLTQPGGDAEPGAVLDVVQRGYRIGDKVVRPARVIVAE